MGASGPDDANMPNGSRVLIAVLCGFLAAGAMTGCGTPAGAILSADGPSLQWPPPPLAPRIRYLGQIASQEDLKAARSGWQNVWGFVLGEEPTPQMQSPLSACFGAGQRLYVADPAAMCVHLFDLEARTYARIGGEVGIRAPVAVALGPDRLYVADVENAVIVCTDTQGNLLQTVGRGLLQRPAGLCFRPADGSLLVADSAAHQILRFSATGQLVERIGSRGEAPGQFNFPTAVSCDRIGRVYVSDSLNCRIQILDPRGRVVRTIGSRGNRPGDLSMPKGVGIDSDGHIYTVDAHFENIQIFEPSGQILLPFGSEGTGPGQFWLPAGIFIDSQDRIWVCDSYNHRVQVFQYLKATPESPATQAEPSPASLD